MEVTTIDKKYPIPFHYFTLLLTMVLCACSTNSTTPPPEVNQANPRQYNHPIPLNVGNWWRYQERTTNKKYFSVIVKSRVIAGKTWYLMNDMNNLYWVRNVSSGQLEATDFSGMTEIDDQPPVAQVVFKYPITKSEHYTTKGGNVTATPCESKVSVPAGDFDCIRYRFDLGASRYSISTINPDIGIIKNEFYNGEIVEVIELTSFGEG